MADRLVSRINCCLVFFIASTGWVEAMDRYYCAVDDAQLKLSVEASFKEEPRWPLASLRGVVVFKPEAPLVQKRSVKGAVRLELNDVTQSRHENGRFQLRTSSVSGVDQDETSIDIVFDVKMIGNDINRFAGTYDVTVRPKGNDNAAAAVERDGVLNCKRF
ncbi:hypothetical protein [Allorhizobium taibaishanense]|jgi:heat shock protein HslJ|uniref:Heat shock protein HslJ n=1 Tax=Allorhizobium taibaishanense TaxID=887144 RepID=A0A1Q9A659_9HYPH|nr:hypothetical protein [Allorhizobium taibaishanense]MBB4008828.1 heat shock protein HslJ [Allorhizobium taibaishanense]OLP50058.1 hypothetical protein BJF91_11995 [Allorhizobium taibaishanense]